MKIKKATKLLALVLSAVMLISIVPMVASAAAVLTLGTVTMDPPVDNVVNFTVGYTATEVEQVTVLAVVGNTETEPTTIDNTNIVYIDQQASTTATSFSFKVETSKFANGYNKIFIKIGGTAIDAAVPAPLQTYVEPTPSASPTPSATPMPVVTTENLATVAATKGIDNAYSVTDSKVIVVDIRSLLTTPEMGVANDYKIVVRGTELRYNAVNSKFYGTPLLGTIIPLSATDFTITKEARTALDILFGDVNKSGGITASDLVSLKKRAGGDATLLLNGDISGDVNLSGNITASDLVSLKKRAGGDITPFLSEQ